MELIWYCLRLRGWEEREAQVIRTTETTQERTVLVSLNINLGKSRRLVQNATRHYTKFHEYQKLPTDQAGCRFPATIHRQK